MQRINRQSGNVFFIILIGIALFSALVMLISRGMRSQGTTAMSAHDAELAAVDIINYGQRVERAVNRLRLKGCSENEITFEGNDGFSKRKNGTAYDYTNTNSPSDYSCHVFHPNGGAIEPLIVAEKAAIDPSLVPSNWMHPRSFVVTPTRAMGNGTDSGAEGTDLLLWIGRLNDEVCMKINDKLGITNPGNAPPTDSWDCNSNLYQGAYTACTNPIGNTVTQLQGKTAYCVRHDASGLNNIYIQVLIVR